MKPTIKTDRYELYLGKWEDVLSELGAVSAVVTDPPYGINYNPQRSLKNCSKWGKQQVFAPVIGDDTPFDPAPFLALGKCLFWGANHYASRLPDSAGWLTWDKRRGATVSQGFIAFDVELAWTNFLGTAKIFSHLWAGLCRESEIGQHLHPTQKPVALMEWCLGFLPDAVSIFDPFMGSGATGVAALREGRYFVGVERDEKYFEITRQRLECETGIFSPREFGGLFAETD